MHYFRFVSRLRSFFRHAAAIIAGVTIVSLAGCGGGGTSPEGAGPIPIDDLLVSLETAECRAFVACGQAPDVDSCRAAIFVGKDSIVGDPRRQEMVAAVKRGTVIYDAARARQCLDEIAGTCVIHPPRIPSCDDIFSGKVADGGACRVGAECVSHRCTGPCLDGCCAGTCAITPPPLVPIGGSCNQGPCVVGAYCQAATGICVAELPPGAPCAGTDKCQLPGQCVTEPGGTPMCVVAPDQGGACTPSTSHDSCLRIDNYCDPMTLVCVRQKPPGADCAGSDECVSLALCQNGVCTPKATLGQACDSACLGHLGCVQGMCFRPIAYDFCMPMP